MADLYRKSSIEKLSNPEQLDRAIKITSPMSWLALIGVVVVIVATIVWSVLGSLPETVTVEGLVASPENVGVLYSDESSTVKSVSVEPGDDIRDGDTVVTVTSSTGEEKKITATEDGTVTQILVEEGDQLYAGAEVIRYTPDSADEQVIVCYVSLSVAAQLSEGMKVLVYPTAVDSQKYGHMEATVEKIEKYAASSSNLWYVVGADNLVADQLVANGPVVAVTCSIRTDDSTTSGYYWTSENGGDLTVSNNTYLSCQVVVSEDAPITKLITFLKDIL